MSEQLQHQLGRESGRLPPPCCEGPARACLGWFSPSARRVPGAGEERRGTRRHATARGCPLVERRDQLVRTAAGLLRSRRGGAQPPGSRSKACPAGSWTMTCSQAASRPSRARARPRRSRFPEVRRAVRRSSSTGARCRRRRAPRLACGPRSSRKLAPGVDIAAGMNGQFADQVLVQEHREFA